MSPRRAGLRHTRGLTLIELLVAVALGMVILLATFALLSASLAAWKRAGAGAETLTEVADAVDQLARDVRVAGYDPARAGVAGVVGAEASRLELTADLDASGTIDLASLEHVIYRPSAAGDTLQRMVGAQSMPIVAALAPDGFRLRYFDELGGELLPGTPGITALVRLVTIEITTRRHDGVAGVRVAGGARLLNPR